MAFIDKINPDVPEGRLLIRNGDYVLKDPEKEVIQDTKLQTYISSLHPLCERLPPLPEKSVIQSILLWELDLNRNLFNSI